MNGNEYTVVVTVYNDRLEHVVQREFKGQGDTRTVVPLGSIDLSRSQTKSSMLFFVVDLFSGEKRLARNYYFTNYEVRRGVIMTMPRTQVDFVREGQYVTLTNTGDKPAMGVYVESPGHAHEFVASENYLWLDPGESHRITVNVDFPVVVKGWNID